MCSCLGSQGGVGSDATACRGSDTLLLLNEASALEARLLSALLLVRGGAEEGEGRLYTQVCVFTLDVAQV